MTGKKTGGGTPPTPAPPTPAPPTPAPVVLAPLPDQCKEEFSPGVFDAVNRTAPTLLQITVPKACVTFGETIRRAIATPEPPYAGSVKGLLDPYLFGMGADLRVPNTVNSGFYPLPDCSAGVCTGNVDETCYYEPRCAGSSMAGCDAGGKPTCRFCGFGTFASIPCLPLDEIQTGGWGELALEEDQKRVITMVPKTIEDIQNIVRFANKTSSLLVVHNTGHDYIGRSIVDLSRKPLMLPGRNPSSLVEHKFIRMRTSFMRSIKFWGVSNATAPPYDMHERVQYHTTTTQLFDCDGACEPGPAVTVSAGSLWQDIADGMNQLDVWAMKGASLTVGAAGGWLLDGGYGLFPKLVGMGVDNIKEITLVTMDGVARKLNENTNTELFNAVRGGGPGAFGIVADATYKLHPPMTSISAFNCMYEVPIDDFLDFSSAFFSHLPIRGRHWGGFLNWKRRFLGGQEKIQIEIYLRTANLTASEVEHDLQGWFDAVDQAPDHFGMKPEASRPTFASCKIKQLAVSTFDETDFTEGTFTRNKLENGTLKDEITNNWWEYESFEDYIVTFGSRYLPNWGNDYSGVGEKLLAILKAGTTTIQCEISKGMYNASETVLAENQKTMVNPAAHNAIGLIYIRTYMTHYWPNKNGEIAPAEMDKITMKYEDADSICEAVSSFYGEGYTRLLYADFILPAWGEYKIDPCISSLVDKCVSTGRKRDICNREVLEVLMKESQVRGRRMIGELINAFPNAGTYPNHIDYFEPAEGVPELKWGKENAATLKKLKAKWDPAWLLQCHQCVGP